MATQMSEYLGKLTLQGVSALGRWAVFSVRALREVHSGQALGTRLVRAVFEQGVRCVPVIAVVAAFTGMVLGLQGHYVLSRFGATGMLGTLVSLSLCRELGPVLAALMIAGQAGTALSAELGIQRSTEQIDAIELLDVSPEGFLVGARLLGAFFVFPVLTAFFVLVGVAGGWLSGCVLMPQDSNSYWGAVHEAIRGKDIRECLLKAAVFGFLTTTLCAYQGFYAHRSGEAGARAVGLATVRGIVLSSIAILAADYLITAVLL
jgi:phospholipid/cholesterol/gamma-HCH transport system permease protein